MDHTFPAAIPLHEWNKRRYLTAEEYDFLKTAFGTEKEMVMSKKMLVAETYSNYKILSLEVLRKLDKLEFSQEAWRNCSTFPPRIARAIVEVM